MTDGMMNDTDPLVDALSELEFDPACDLWYESRLRILGWDFKYSRRKECKRPARWVGNVPCCNETFLACEPCRSSASPLDVYECCGRRILARRLTWRKI